jgi:hypothetical protein
MAEMGECGLPCSFGLPTLHVLCNFKSSKLAEPSTGMDTRMRG